MSYSCQIPKVPFPRCNTTIETSRKFLTSSKLTGHIFHRLMSLNSWVRRPWKTWMVCIEHAKLFYVVSCIR